MKISIETYILEDNVMHGKIIKKQLEKYSDSSNFVKLNIFTVQNYIEYYKNPHIIKISNADIFIIDIDLNTFFTGIQLAEKIRNLNTKVSILF